MNSNLETLAAQVYDEVFAIMLRDMWLVVRHFLSAAFGTACQPYYPVFGRQQDVPSTCLTWTGHGG